MLRLVLLGFAKGCVGFCIGLLLFGAGHCVVFLASCAVGFCVWRADSNIYARDLHSAMLFKVDPSMLSSRAKGVMRNHADMRKAELP